MLEEMEGEVNRSNGCNNGGVQQMQSNGDSSEEELSVLPRHTKVVVTGNNRTKSVLVGLQGVVKKAVGLGGWHWLVLTNGIEVKLQRNALSVIEAPTGQEDDDDIESESMQWNNHHMVPDDVQKPHKPRHRSHKIVGPTPKSLCRSRTYDQRSKDLVSPSKIPVKVNLSKLDMSTLRRYWRYFNLLIECYVEQEDDCCYSNLSKEQLVDAVQRHFMEQQLDEFQVIVGFIQSARRLKNRSNN